MESKYLIGFVRRQPGVMWDRIDDFEEIVSEDGQVTLKFKEDGVEYEYQGSPDRGYREVNGKAPNFDDYQYTGRRTALRHDLFNPERRAPADYRPHRTGRRHELEDDSDFEADEFLRRAARSPRRGCGYVGSCGPVGANNCGLWG